MGLPQQAIKIKLGIHMLFYEHTNIIIIINMYFVLAFLQIVYDTVSRLG